MRLYIILEVKMCTAVLQFSELKCEGNYFSQS